MQKIVAHLLRENTRLQEEQTALQKKLEKKVQEITDLKAENESLRKDGSRFGKAAASASQIARLKVTADLNL